MVSFTSSKGNILVSGGTGYIGVHTVVSLLEAGYYVTVVDNLYNSSPIGLLERVPMILNIPKEYIRDHRSPSTSDKTPVISFYDIDCCNKQEMEEKIFKTNAPFHACIHFAGLKAVGESVRNPLLYYRNNIDSTLSLLELLDQYDCRKFIFSSSATVYGDSSIPYNEELLTGKGVTNPYGRSKYMIEEMLKDFMIAVKMKANEAGHKPWSITLLRYFNPISAHPSGLIGEDPNGIPNNLMPYICQVVVNKREALTIYGNDYPTPDGTGVRDYIHILDLAEGHVASLKYNEEGNNGLGSLSIFNLGSGNGISVIELVEAMRRASGHPLPVIFGARRPGDLPAYYADATKAKNELNWVAKRNVDDMCRDVWNWQSKNPNGYQA